MSEDEKQQYLTFAKDIAYQAGKLMSEYYRKNQKVELKTDNSPVTIADKAINSLLIERVRQTFPEHGILGEEESWQPDREVVWVCDPIDGTVPFIMHIPLAVFSLALVINGKPEIAVCYNPITGDMFWAQSGGGAFRGDQAIRVSERQWRESPLLLGSSHGGSREPVDHPVIWRTLSKQRVHVTKLPGTVFKGCLIAEGSADGRIFIHSGAHDIAALKLIIEEAGGKVTDLDGKQQRYDRPINGAVMSNGKIHNHLLDLVKKYENIRD